MGQDETESKLQPPSRFIMQWHYSGSPWLIQSPWVPHCEMVPSRKGLSAMWSGQHKLLRVHNAEQKIPVYPSQKSFCSVCSVPQLHRRAATQGCHDQYSWECLPRLLCDEVKTDLIYRVFVCVRVFERSVDCETQRGSKWKTDGARVRWREFDTDWTARLHWR